MQDSLIELARSRTQFMSATPITFSDLVFEGRVQLKCFHCKRYGVNWTCPPKIPDINYKSVLQEYGSLLLFWCKMPFNEETYEFIRRESTNLVHRTLLEAEKLLLENNNSLAISFIGGSCKLCAQGCGTDGCRQPQLARIPLEGIGVNVVKSVKKFGINITFPPKKLMYRVGLLGW